MFNLGGRGATWGLLFMTNILRKNLKFGTELCDQLVNTWVQGGRPLLFPMTGLESDHERSYVLQRIRKVISLK